MARPPSGIARSVRRLAAKGWSAEAIARVYPGLSRADLRRILGLPEREPARAWEPRLRASAWSPTNGPEYRDSDELLATAGGGIEPEIAAATGIASNAEASGTRPVPPPSGDWGAMHAPRPGRLSAEDLDRLRRGRATGRALTDLAEDLGVSVATVKRALRPSYRPRPAD
jgi:hypothetical protein